MKKIFFAVLAVVMVSFFTATTATAVKAAEGNAPVFSGAIEMGAFSDYVASGSLLLNQAVGQGSLNVSHNPSGLSLSVWASMSPNGKDDFGDEIDLTVQYDKELSGYLKGYNLSLSAAYWNLINLGHAKGDIIALKAKLETPPVTKAEITFLGSVTANVPTDKNTLEGGMTYELGLRGNIKTIDVDYFASVYGNDGVFGYQSEIISSGVVGVSKTFKLWGAEITPQVNYLRNLGHSDGIAGTDGKFFGGVNVAYPFDFPDTKTKMYH